MYFFNDKVCNMKKFKKITNFSILIGFFIFEQGWPQTESGDLKEVTEKVNNLLEKVNEEDKKIDLELDNLFDRSSQVKKEIEEEWYKIDKKIEFNQELGDSVEEWKILGSSWLWNQMLPLVHSFKIIHEDVKNLFEEVRILWGEISISRTTESGKQLRDLLWEKRSELGRKQSKIHNTIKEIDNEWKNQLEILRKIHKNGGETPEEWKNRLKIILKNNYKKKWG